MKTGIELIAEERKRQIESEGWTPEHDAQHNKGEIINAAACYLEQGGAVQYGGKPHPMILSLWPWGYKWWKPSQDPVRNLVKAGALIAAEIDRIQHSANKALRDSESN